MVALGRTGSYCGNGSGDIAIAFTTANRVPHRGGAAVEAYRMVRDDRIDPVFLAAVEAVEEAIISALYHARTLTGFQGRTSVGLRDFLGLA